jgi:hypothetical protein
VFHSTETKSRQAAGTGLEDFSPARLPAEFQDIGLRGSNPGATQIHRVIPGLFPGCGFRAIPDHQQGAGCKTPRSDDRGVSIYTPQGGAREGNAADDALMLNQGANYPIDSAEPPLLTCFLGKKSETLSRRNPPIKKLLASWKAGFRARESFSPDGIFMPEVTALQAVKERGGWPQ